MSIIVRPRILRIFISPGHDFKGRHGKSRLNHGTRSVDLVECLATRGLAGDRFLDYKENFKGQVTFFDNAEAVRLEKSLGLRDFDTSQLRRNILTEGIDLTKLVGQYFQIDDVSFEGVEECAPCYWMNEALGPGAESLMKGRGGLRCRILTSGILKVGPVELKGAACSEDHG